MTDAELIRSIVRAGYSVWEDLDGSTAKRLTLIAQRLERDEPPPPRHSDK
jgi:hypothetical protein